ncbi:MAG: ABC transporter ATP-binding protein [Aestuariivirgaceae bacterium]
MPTPDVTVPRPARHNDRGAFRRLLWIFFKAEGTRPYLVLFCLVIAGAFEAVSLSTMLPTATKIAGGPSENSSVLNSIVGDAISWFGFSPTLPVLIIVGTAALAAKSILSFLALTYAGYSVALVSVNLRKRLLKALFAANWAYFTSLHGGQIANTISVNTTRAGEAYYLAAQSVALALQGTVYLIVAFLVSVKLALAGCVFGVLTTLALSGLIRLGRRSGYKQTDRTAQLVTHLSDALGNIKPIKTMNRQEHFLAYSAAKIRSLKRSLINQAIAREGIYYGGDLLSALVIGLGVYAAAVYWRIPLPEMIVLGVIFFQVTAIISKVQRRYQKVAAVESAYVRSREQIEDLERNIERDEGHTTPTLKKSVVFKDVSCAHDDKAVIHNASLVIPAGSITVLQGPSGAGKTTLIDLLLGLHKPDSGLIEIDGVSIDDISLRKWRSMVGYVPQELSLLHGSVMTNIALGDRQISQHSVLEALQRAGASGLIDELADGIDTDVGETGSKLSGGQRQRISLARALVLQPKLLILDEVTSALDPQTEQRICDSVASLAGDYTIVVITHRPAWVEIATDLYTIEAGKVRPVPVTAVPGKASTV